MFEICMKEHELHVWEEETVYANLSLAEWKLSIYKADQINIKKVTRRDRTK